MSLPYAGTEGHAGTDTSRQFAEDEAPTAKDRQAKVLAFMYAIGAVGLTVTELKVSMIPHHGTASRVLTVLHQTGKIARLVDTRLNAKIYVLPEFIAGRAVEKFQGTSAKHRWQGLIDARAALLDLMNASGPSGWPSYVLGRSEALSDAIDAIDKMIAECAPEEPTTPTEEKP